MTRFFIFLFCIGIFTGMGCKSDKKTPVPTPEPTSEPTPVPTPVSTPANAQMEVDLSSPAIPGIPEEVMVELINNCTFIDYIFRELPFSLSQDEPRSIKQNILFIDYEKPLVRIPLSCKPDGRKFFQIKGDIKYEADVYILNGCTFYVFVDKQNKPIYANYITQEGIKFYSNIINQASGLQPK